MYLVCVRDYLTPSRALSAGVLCTLQSERSLPKHGTERNRTLHNLIKKETLNDGTPENAEQGGKWQKLLKGGTPD